jgi:predicted dithiol-disulfide oxidoreductase (DUF899 family)
MPEHRVGTQGEWQAERDELLAQEKKLTRLNDEVAERRRQLPWVPVEKQYSFETEDGTKSLADLFDGLSQLLVYHFMFGPSYEAGCPVCSSIADNLDPNAVHLKARDVTLICSSRAPLQKLIGFRERMGWSFNWVSTVGSDFHRDLGFVHTEEELKPFLEGEMPPAVAQNARACGTDVVGYVSDGPGLSAYIRSDGAVYRTYVTTARGLEPAMGYYAFSTGRRRGATRKESRSSGCVATTNTRRLSRGGAAARSASTGESPSGSTRPAEIEASRASSFKARRRSTDSQRSTWKARRRGIEEEPDHGSGGGVKEPQRRRTTLRGGQGSPGSGTSGVARCPASGYLGSRDRQENFRRSFGDSTSSSSSGGRRGPNSDGDPVPVRPITRRCQG